RPSRTLIIESLKRRQSVLHRWGANASATTVVATISRDFDWAFATPVQSPATKGWAIYVAGRTAETNPPDGESSTPPDLREDIKFTELVAATLSALRQVRLLQGQNAVLSQFFSPVVLSAMGSQDTDAALAPREADVTVLFCDLRGFSLEA